MKEPGMLSFRSDNEQRGFTMLPNAVLTSPRLTAGQKVVYALLRHYARDQPAAWPAQARLAHEASLHRSGIVKALQALAEHGLITTERRGQGKPNRYWIEPISDEKVALLASIPKTVAEVARGDF